MAVSLTAAEVAECDYSALPQTQTFPSFHFYTSDWVSGAATQAMNAEESGAFIWLLAQGWMQKPPCSLPNDEKILEIYSKMGKARWKEGKVCVWGRVE